MKWPFVKRDRFETLVILFEREQKKANDRLERIKQVSHQRDKYAAERDEARADRTNALTYAADKKHRTDYLEAKIAAIERCLENGQVTLEVEHPEIKEGEFPKPPTARAILNDLPEEFR